MFAVIKTGGKQYKVASGDVLAIERLPVEVGSHVDFEEVLLIGDGGKMTVGTPFVAGAAVAATVVDQTRGEKILIFKKKRRQNYRRRKGHRQELTIVKIADIYPPGATRKAKPAVEPKPVAKKPEAPKAKETKTEAKSAKKEAKKPAAKAKKDSGKSRNKSRKEKK
jgi:large subunit ribosomal protein L21